MASPGPPPGKDMVWVAGGRFLMGSQDFYPEEAPVHRVTVDGFWIDTHPVTNAAFRRFWKATGHRPHRLPLHHPRPSGLTKPRSSGSAPSTTRRPAR